MYSLISQPNLSQVNSKPLMKTHPPWGYKFHLSFSFIDWQVHKNYLTSVKLISHLWQHCWIFWNRIFFYKLWLAKIIIIFLASQRSFTSICPTFNAKKREFKTMEGDEKKVSLLFMLRHMKVIQDALLYNKIECYNKGVQKKSLSQ